MLADWIALALAGLALAGSVALWLVVLGLAYMLKSYFALRAEGVAAEAKLLAHALPPDDALPHVVVQIPVFNEGAIVERAVEAAARLDWPRGRLHVQVCDDSTDATTAFAGGAAARVSAAGVDAVVLHRGDRSEFKAGALRAAMARTEHEYFAILDVDYVPAPDFLRRCMAALTAEPKLAFVQARPDFLNARESMFTRAQAIILDFHYGLEQPTRSWSGQLLPFNGTCGVWRRAAIEAGGEWRGDTLTEDWDLSYRALLAGWRGVFVATVTCPGELPSSVRVWCGQQRRWAAGVGEVARKVLPALLLGGRPDGAGRWAVLFPLATWLGYLSFAATVVAAVAAIALRPSLALPLGLTVYAPIAALAVMLFVLMLAANRFVRPGAPLAPFLLDFPATLALSCYISWANFRSVPATLAGRRRVFVRTSKQGGEAQAGRPPQ